MARQRLSRAFLDSQDFAKLWTAQTISAFGSIITRDALPLTAIITLGAAPAQVGLLAAAGRLPVLLVGLPAGVWVDRLRRRPILIAADLGRAALLFTIPLAYMLDVLALPQLFLIAFLAGILSVFFEVADQSFLPTVISRHKLVEGNSRLGLSSSLAEIAGPAMAGTLVQLITAPLAVLVDAISFLFSALLLGSIRKQEAMPDPSQRHANMGLEIVEGLRATFGNPILRTLAVSSATFSLLGGFIGALYYLYAIRELELPPALLGIVIASGGIGALAGAALAPRASSRYGLGRALVGSLLVVGLAALLIPLAGGPPPLAASILIVGQLVGDTALMIYFVNEVSLRQAVSPDHVLGRVNASMQFLVAGVGPLGLILGGLLGEALGMRPTLVMGAMGGLLACLWLILSPVRRLQDYPSPPALGGSYIEPELPTHV